MKEESEKNRVEEGERKREEKRKREREGKNRVGNKERGLERKKILSSFHCGWTGEREKVVKERRHRVSKIENDTRVKKQKARERKR